MKEVRMQRSEVSSRAGSEEKNDSVQQIEDKNQQCNYVLCHPSDLYPLT